MNSLFWLFSSLWTHVSKFVFNMFRCTDIIIRTPDELNCASWFNSESFCLSLSLWYFVSKFILCVPASDLEGVISPRSPDFFNEKWCVLTAVCIPWVCSLFLGLSGGQSQEIQLTLKQCRGWGHPSPLQLKTHLHNSWLPRKVMEA